MFYGGKPLRSIAVYRGNAIQSPLAVASMTPNAWGLYDMLGGVWEWVEEDYKEYEGSPVPSRTGHSELQRRGVVRGGSRRTEAQDCRCARRYTFNPHDGGISIGLRIAVDAED
jgi:formylglycine-generating enzyme required for sulfatase activity